MTRQTFRSTAGVLLTILSMAVSAQSAPPLAGAIFTTTENGSMVNGNIFSDICAVYLDGGPGPNAPASAAGLPDGDYYFQVTDPSGAVLLSTDPVMNRQINVAGGVITGVSGAGNHNTGVDLDQGAATIQLCPFLETPNPGGVYKVWVTPTDSFVGDPTQVDSPCGAGCFHGFLPAASKTDNFKVKRGKTVCIDVTKFHDRNGDGLWNRKGSPSYREESLNWPVTVFGPDGDQINGVRFTPFELCNLAPGTYTVVEAVAGYAEWWPWEVSATILDGVFLTPSRTVEIEISKSSRELIFGNK